MKRGLFNALLPGAVCLMSSSAIAAPVYLNELLIDVSVGSGTSPGTLNNTFSGDQTINKVIDAPSAAATEFHNQTTHIWFTADEVGGGLELLFDFNQEYDITTLHFWNYTAEGFDVDQIDFTFFNESSSQVGDLTVFPALGTSPGIMAQDIALAAPLNVQFVTAFLSGSNAQVDFQNIGFTASLSSPEQPDLPDQPTTEVIPVPAGLPLLLTGLAAISLIARREVT
jgi:hypothetical protein